MQRDTKKNYQLYGRNDMIMLDEHNKIYGSLGLAEPYIVATKEGETLLLNGAKDNEPFIGLSLYGKSHQNTVAGNQLLNPELFEDDVIGNIHFVKNHDGGISVTGTAEDNVSYFMGNYINTFEDGQVYSVSKGTTNVRVNIVANLKDGGTRYGNAITIDKDAMVSVRPYIQVLSGNTVNEIVYPMLNKGTTALPWEPYTGGQPSPNPDYPQEIVSVGDDGEIGVNVYGGNFVLNPEEVVHFEGNIGDGVNSIGLSKFIAIAVEEQLLKNDISFSFDSDGESESNFSLFIRIKYGTEYKYLQTSISFKIINGRNIAEISKSVFTNLIVTGVDEITVQIRPSNPLIDDVNFNITNLMLSIGSTALPFEPYKQPQSLIVSTPNGLPGIPVSSGGNYTDENGQQWISDEIDFKRGKYVKRVGRYIFESGKDVRINNNASTDELARVYFSLPNKLVEGYGINNVLFCNVLRNVIKITANGMPLYSCLWEDSANIYVCVPKSWGTEEQISQKLYELGAEFVYLITPIETDLTPEQITAYQSLHTNYPTTTVMNDEGAGMKAIYKQIENGG